MEENWIKILYIFTPVYEMRHSKLSPNQIGRKTKTEIFHSFQDEFKNNSDLIVWISLIRLILELTFFLNWRVRACIGISKVEFHDISSNVGAIYGSWDQTIKINELRQGRE